MGRVTLTFDNGPEPAVTPLVLDCLGRHSLHATFFVLGEKAATGPGGDLIARSMGEGHRIGNHTWSHARYLGLMDAGPAIREFDRCDELLASLGVADRLFRPVGGGRLGKHLLHPMVVERLQARGYTCVLWNSVPGDWRDPHGWLERAVADCRSREWTLLVLHDIASGAMDHLEEFLGRLDADGHEFTLEFPPECLPVVEGRVVLPLEEWMPAEGERPD